MKSQQYNQGSLGRLDVMIDKTVLESFQIMAKNSGRPLEELVVISMMRFQSTHTDYLGTAPKIDVGDEDMPPK